MLIGNVRPTTLAGVKSLAAQLRKQRGIKYSTALDFAARAADCTNYRNARGTLPENGSLISRPYVLLTMYWLDKDHRHQVGRETLKVELSKPLLEICGRSALKRVRGFGGLRMVADDHLVCDMLADRQSQARDLLCTAERSLRFMEHTGLRPPRNHREANVRVLVHDKLPNSDHPTSWIDPTSGQFVLIDEPYGDAPDDADRNAWSARTGWQILKSSWPGMYNPYSCDLFVVTDCHSGYDADALVETINALPAPLLESAWPGESSASWDTFVSPLALTPQDVRRARCRGTIYPAAGANTVPYSFGLGSSWRRPAAKMDIAGHIEAGGIIKAILNSRNRPYGVYQRMNSVRATLEDWMSLEIKPGQLDGPEFFKVYYSKSDGDALYEKTAMSPAGIVAMLKELEQKLLAAYPNCAPLRKQLHRIKMSIALINKMKTAQG